MPTTAYMKMYSYHGGVRRQRSERLGFVKALMAQGIAAPLALGANLLLARLLQPAQFGVYITLLSAGLVGGAIAAYGVGPLIIREVGASPSVLPTITKWAVQVTTLLSGLVMAFLLVWLMVGSSLGAPPNNWLERLPALLIVPCSVMAIMVVALLRGLVLVAKSIAVTNLWKNALLLVGVIVLSVTNVSRVADALWLQVFSFGLASAIGVYWLCAAQQSRQFEGSTVASPDVRQKWYRAAWHFFAVSAATLIFARLDVIIVSALAGSVQAGLFGAAARLAQIGAISGLVWIAWLQPRISRYIRTNDKLALKRTLKLGFVGAVSMTLVVVGIGWLFGRPLMTWMGTQYAGALIPFYCLLIGYIVWAASVPFYALLSMVGHESLLARILWSQALITIAISFPLVKAYAATGGAVSWAGGMAFGSLAIIVGGIHQGKRYIRDVE